MSSGTSFPDSDARRSLKQCQLKVNAIQNMHNVPDSTFALKHPVSLVNALALEVDFLEEQAIDLLKLHFVLVRKLLDQVPKALDLCFELDLVLVDGLPKGLENVKLIAIDKGHY